MENGVRRAKQVQCFSSFYRLTSRHAFSACLTPCNYLCQCPSLISQFPMFQRVDRGVALWDHVFALRHSITVPRFLIDNRFSFFFFVFQETLSRSPSRFNPRSWWWSKNKNQGHTCACGTLPFHLLTLNSLSKPWLALKQTERLYTNNLEIAVQCPHSLNGKFRARREHLVVDDHIGRKEIRTKVPGRVLLPYFCAR